MSYCVNCGVELDATAERCPLCRTPVRNPNQAVDRDSPPPFPTERGEVPLASRGELAVLISAMLGSVAICCGFLNLFLRAERLWSLYVIGAAAVLWFFITPPLLWRKMPLPLAAALDTGAVGLYVLLIAWEMDGLDWYFHLALPIVALLGLLLLVLAFLFQKGRRSTLTTISLVIGFAGIFIAGVELFGDFYFYGAWQPSWSLVVLAVTGALEIPLLVVRRVPGLRKEAQRRLHM